MSLRTVRLNQDEEATLKRVRAATGLTVSAALKRGLRALQRDLEPAPAPAAAGIASARPPAPKPWCAKRSSAAIASTAAPPSAKRAPVELMAQYTPSLWFGRRLPGHHNVTTPSAPAHCA